MRALVLDGRHSGLVRAAAAEDAVCSCTRGEPVSSLDPTSLEVLTAGIKRNKYKVQRELLA